MDTFDLVKLTINMEREREGNKLRVLSLHIL